MLRGHAPGGSEVALEVVVIQTAGDRAPDVPLEHLEGIGFFARELEAALLDGRCDLAVHSAKDLPTEIHHDLVLGAFPPRADPRDVLVAAPGRWLATLPPGASVATSSVRRSAQILHFRPDLRAVPIRGNIDTRLGKLDRGVYDALCLAGAGLVRMEWQERITEWLEPEIMLPAPGQGALVLEVRRGDDDLVQWLGGLDDRPTRIAVEAERAFVARLGSGCRAPAAALAQTVGDPPHPPRGGGRPGRRVAHDPDRAARRLRGGGPGHRASGSLPVGRLHQPERRGRLSRPSAGLRRRDRGVGPAPRRGHWSGDGGRASGAGAAGGSGSGGVRRRGPGRRLRRRVSGGGAHPPSAGARAP